MKLIFWIRLSLNFAIASLVGIPNCFAGLFRIESETYSSARKNDSYQFELPFSENMSTSYISNKKDFEFNSNFSILADPTGNLHPSADLHILDVKFQTIPDFMEIKLGRSLQSSLATGSIDMLAANFFWLNKQIQFGPFVGLEKKTGANTTEIYGLHLDYYSDETLPYFISTKIIEQNESAFHTPAAFTSEPRTHLFLLSGKKNFGSNWSPEFLFDSQSNLSSKNLERLETGVDFYPSISTYIKLRALTYDVLPDSGASQPIYSIFSLGRLYETRIQFQKKIHNNLINGISLFTDNYQLQKDKRTTGFGGEWELKWTQDSGFINNIDNNIYAFTSYGGKVIGNRILVQSNLKNEFYGIFDIAYYEKITSSKRNVINTEIGCSQYFGKQYKFTFGGELNNNNILAYDLRAFAKLTFLLWNDT